MLFDRACKFAELGSPAMAENMKTTPLFVVRVQDVRAIPKGPYRERYSNTFLPLPPHCWIEIQGEHDFGLYIARSDVAGGQMMRIKKEDDAETRVSIREERVEEDEHGGPYFVRMFTRLPEHDNRLAIAASTVSEDVSVPSSYIECDKSGGKVLLHEFQPLALLADEDSVRMAEDAAEMMFSALALINQPSRFVVKVSNETARHVQRGKIPRSDQRPRYILMPLEEIDRIVRQPNHENVGRKLEAGHRRRAHLKRLRSDRFRYKQGQVVRVKACWVGPKVGHAHGERYEVLTEI